jgi:nucleoid-associated protein YgaU
MAANEKSGDEKQALGPSVVLGLVGAIVVLVLLGAGIWGVSKIVSKVRESSEDEESETVAEEEEDKGEQEDEGDGEQESMDEQEDEGEGESEDEQESENEQKKEGEGEQESEDEQEKETTEESTTGNVVGEWVANNYVSGDISGDKYTVVRGDTLWEIAEARYGSGFEWHRILEANEDKVGYSPSIGWAVIVPGQVLTLPE